MSDLQDNCPNHSGLHLPNSLSSPMSKNPSLFFQISPLFLILPPGLSSPLLFLIDLVGDSQQLDVLYAILQLVMSFCFSSPVGTAGPWRVQKQRKLLDHATNFHPNTLARYWHGISTRMPAGTAGLLRVPHDSLPERRGRETSTFNIHTRPKMAIVKMFVFLFPLTSAIIWLILIEKHNMGI